MTSVSEILEPIREYVIPPLDCAGAQVELMAMTQGEAETCSSYGLRISEKLDHALESARSVFSKNEYLGLEVSYKRTAIRSFIDGLKDQLEARIINSMNPSTLKDAIRLADKAERAKSVKSMFATTIQQVPVAAINHVSAKKDPECYNCHEIGHISRNCTKARKERKNLTCNYCHKRGHIEKKCFKKHPELRKRKNNKELEVIREDKKQSKNASSTQPDSKD